MRVNLGLGRGGNVGRRLFPPARMLSVLLAVVLVVGAIVSISPASAQSTEPFATAAVVPADVLSYSVVPLRGDSAQWEQALALLERAGLSPAVEQTREEALGAGTTDELALDLFLGGEIALVVTDVAVDLLIEESLNASAPESGVPAGPDTGSFTNRSEAGLAAVITSESPDFIAASVQAAIADTARELGSDVQQSEHEGVAIEYVEVPSGRASTPFATARVDDFILVAGFPADLEAMIETSNGDRAPLSELDEFDQVLAALDEEHLAFGFVNTFPSDAIRASLRNAGLPGELITGPAAAGGFLVAADELGFRLETVSLGLSDSAAATTFPESEVLAQTPSDVIVFFAATDLAGTGILDVLGAFLLSASGLVGPADETQSLDDMLDAQFEQLARTIGVNLRTDLLQQLTGEYGFWLELDPTTGAIDALFASGVDDPTVVSAALFQLTLLVQSGGGGELTVITRPVGEDDRVFAVETGDPIVPLVEYGLVGDQLVVGLGNAVENVGEGPESPLAESENYEAIMSALPEATAGIFYVDLEQAIPLLASAADEADVDISSSEPVGDDTSDSFAGATTSSAAGDASPDCARYGSQPEAQAAYDAFDAGSFRLDQDFDGEACEDFFSPPAEALATPVTALPLATPEATASLDVPSSVSLAAFTAYGMVAYEEDGNSRTSSLLLVTEPEE